MKPEFRDVRRAVYALKRKLPQQLVLRRTSGDTVDVATGRKASTLSSITIARAVVMPAKQGRSNSYDTVFAFTAKPSNRGVAHDDKVRDVLVDRRDVPSSFVIDMNVHAIFQGQRWEVKGIEEFEEAECVVLTLSRTDGTLPMNQTNASISDGLNLRDSTANS